MPRRKKEEEEVYHVEVITKARVSEDHDWEYLVKWAGYDSDADSWEPTANVQQCDRLLASFWRHVGTDDEDYPVGYEVAAREDWIDKEKEYFAETFVKSSKKKSGRDRQERRKSKSSTPPISDSSTDQSESPDEGPSSGKPATKKPDRKIRVVDTESEPEFDLREQVKVVSSSKTTALPPRENPKVKRQELSATTSGPVSIAPPRVTAIRTHQDQRTNPLVKSMNLTSRSVEAGSSLSTKQRVAAGIPPPLSGPKPLPLAPKKSLPSLSFKKIKPLVPPCNQIKDTVVPSTPTETLPASVAQPTDLTFDTDAVADVFASPQPMVIDQAVDFFASVVDDAGPPGGSSEILTVPIPAKSQEEINAESFLQTVPIPVLNSPLEMADQSIQPTIELNKTLTIPKIPKKWRWSGDLFINVSEDKTEHLCVVTIADPSGTGNSSHINLLLSSQHSLQISKLYPILDLPPLLQACGQPQYFGRLESNEPSEEVIIHGLGHHLTSEGLAAAIPLFLDGTEVAVLVIFPGTQHGFMKVLQVPEYLSGSPLLVVLLPFVVSTMTSTNVAGWRSVETVMQSSFSTPDVLVSHKISQEVVMLYQAMSLLCFPKVLLDFLNSSTGRAYCIWPLPDPTSLGLDTALLQYVLKSTKATSAKVEEDIRVIFISNRDLETLHTMPSFVTRRVNSPEIQFWAYGYSANLTCERWGVQEIYPLGGIITFTASALAEDLEGCHQLISQVIEHPFWDCHLVPEVLAVSHLLCSNGDSSPSGSCLGPFLDLIDQGLISAIRMPEKGHSSQGTWLSQVLDHTNASRHELLGKYLEILGSNPLTTTMTSDQLVAFTNNEIIKDLSRAQIQPAFMENYRRFVVIRATSEESILIDQNGLEWSTVPLFSFSDDYFQS